MWLCGCVVVWLCGCVVVGLLGCWVVGLLGCWVVGLLGCLVVLLSKICSKSVPNRSQRGPKRVPKGSQIGSKRVPRGPYDLGRSWGAFGNPPTLRSRDRSFGFLQGGCFLRISRGKRTFAKKMQDFKGASNAYTQNPREKQCFLLLCWPLPASGGLWFCCSALLLCFVALSAFVGLWGARAVSSGLV